MRTLGQRLGLAMEEAGIEAAELCKRAHAIGGKVDPPRISRMLADERGVDYPTVNVLVPVAEVLGVNVRWLWDGTGERYAKPSPGRVALEKAFETVVWPSPIVIEAADIATQRARAEADMPAGRERVVSVWMARLRQLYDEALAMPESLEERRRSSSRPPSSPSPTKIDGTSARPPRRARRS